ncbi:MAG: amylo-alpha-1,6-glucosidase [Capsulimonadaceae bacterium]|nr:amylo-alpha-1,6-glucosidase [Capsulimonadaceae bacterium]
MTHFTHETLQNWDVSNHLEWLVTNGIGGYGSGSLSGANTRRYHGLLVAACEPPLGRTVMLSKLEEEVRIEEQVYYLSSNKYPSVIYPQGYRHLVEFDSDPIPTFTYSVHEGTVILQKQVWMAHGKNTVYVRYTVLKAPEPLLIAVSPFLAYKDYHSEQHRWDGFTARMAQPEPTHIEFNAFEGALPIHLRLTPKDTFTFTSKAGWYFNYEHEREEERGLDAFEDLYCPGEFVGTLGPGRAVTLCATVEPDEPVSPHEALASELQRLEMLVKQAPLSPSASPVVRSLVRAADQFVIAKSDRVSRATVIAGYPWFTDWGRDTMISLPGLCLTTGRFDTAREILLSFAGAVTDGLIPNRFNDNGTGAEFNTVDATLWMFQAARAYAEASGDWDLLTKKLYDVFASILQCHVDGTHYAIRVDESDGLLRAGEPGIQLTWMDARFHDYVFTPRIGKPIEIQALWYNALQVMAEVAERAGKPGKKYVTMANKAKRSFLKKFANPDASSLFDVVDGPEGNDAKIRPNQIFALSLTHPILDPKSKLAKAVVETVERELMTPRGLRTLATSDASYIGLYGPGDQGRRDSAYHQGCVWPWLFGAYADAYRAVRGSGDMTCVFENVEKMLGEYGVGSIPEIYDGDLPHAPNGCIAQAWSVAELLRVMAKH